MKKLIIFLFSAVVLALPLLVLAQGMTPTMPGGPPNAQGMNMEQLGNSITSIMGYLFGVIAVVMFVIAGILFLTAAGSPEKIQQARNAFMWGVVGVIVGIIAFSIISIVMSFLA